MKKVGKFAAYALGAVVLLLAVGVVLLTFDWNRLAPMIEERVSDATGRELKIGGLSLDLWSWTPEATARDIVLANAPWGSRPEMARIKELYVRIRLKPLLVGRLEVERMRVVEPDILLESKGDEVNWKFGKKDEKQQREDFPVLHQLLVERGRVGYRAPELDEPIEARIDRLAVRTESYEHPVELELKGSYKREPVALQGTLGPFRELRSRSRPYPVSLTAEIGASRFAVEGGIQEPLQLKGVSAKLDAQGKTLDQFHRLLGLPLPKLGPYALSGTVERRGDVWSARGIRAKLGESNVQGEIAFRTQEQPPRIVADLKSDKLVLDDLTAFLGKEKEPGNRKADSAATAKAAAKTSEGKKKAGGQRLIPDKPLAIPKLQRMNADVRFGGKAISYGTLDVRDLGINLKLEGGELLLEPVELVLAEGRIRLHLRLDTTGKVPAGAAGIDVRGMDLNALLSLFGKENEAAGIVRGKIDVEARGGSLHDLAASARGGGILVMEGGRVRNILLEAVALDLQEALAQWVSGDKSTVRINCLAMPLTIRDGRVVPDPGIFDTTDALVEIRGFIDLGKETTELTLKPYPKDFSLFNTLTSINIKGDLARRTASISRLEAVGKLVLKALAAPFMTVLSGEIEEDAKQRTPCARLSAEFRRNPAEPPADKQDAGQRKDRSP